MDAPHSNTPVQQPHVPYDPDRLPSTPAVFTAQQQREMGVMDDKGRTIQPMNAFLMIVLGFLGVAVVLLAIIVVVWKLTG